MLRWWTTGMQTVGRMNLHRNLGAKFQTKLKQLEQEKHVEMLPVEICNRRDLGNFG